MAKGYLEKHGFCGTEIFKYSCAYHKSQGLDYVHQETVGAAYV